MNAIAAEVLRMLQSAPASAAELAAAVGLRTTAEAGAEPDATMERLLEQLDESGVIEPARS